MNLHNLQTTFITDFERLFRTPGFDARPVSNSASKPTTSKEPCSSKAVTFDKGTLLSDRRSFPSALLAAKTKSGGSTNSRKTLAELQETHPSLDLDKVALHLLETAHEMVPLDCDETPPERCFFGKQKHSAVYVVFPTETIAKASPFQWITDDDQV